MDSEFRKWADCILEESLPDIITNEWIIECLSEKEKNGNFSLFTIWGFCYRDLSNYDLSKIDKELLLRVPFDSATIWPDLLPMGFDPKSLLNNKHLGYGFSEVHKQGITGKGILVAVIDHPTNVNHIEVKDNIKEYIILDEKYNFPHFHGVSVLSYLCGKNIGIAPDVEVIFYGAQPYIALTKEEKNNNIVNFAIRCLKDIKNKILSGLPIRIINMSSSWLYYGSTDLKKEAANLVEELLKLDCVVIDSPKFLENSSYVDCPANKDFNNIDNYVIPSFFKVDTSNRINFLSGGKPCCSYLTTDQYIFNPTGSASYTIPQLTGFYALALQVNPKLTFDEFSAICFNNSIFNINKIRIVNPVNTIETIKELLVNKK